MTLSCQWRILWSITFRWSFDPSPLSALWIARACFPCLCHTSSGINIFLDGFVPTENLRFRDESLNFKITDAELEEIQNRAYQYKYPGMVKTMGGQFKLTVEPGEFTDSEIVVLLGENGTGKTTFIRLLAGIIKPDDEKISIPELMISVKPQTISPKFQGTVKALLQTKIRDAILHPQFSTDVLKPLHLEEIMDQEIQNISGGELQRVAIVLALGKPADVYLLDEPSAFLDSEQRLAASKVPTLPHPQPYTRLYLHLCLILILTCTPHYRHHHHRQHDSRYCDPPLHHPHPRGHHHFHPPLHTGHQALYLARQEDRLRCGARLHHGHVLG